MKLLLLIALLFLAGCKPGDSDKKLPVPAAPEKVSAITIKLLPLGKTTESFISSSYTDLKRFVPNIELMPHEEIPQFAFYPPRNRYRADSIINWMSNRAKANEVYLAITMQDISTTKGSNPDHGIMGLGYHPGNACIASNFRVRDKKNFYKVVVHELGHTAGLPHCPEKTCFMRDAEGKDPTGEEKEFCKRCTEHLKNKGWKL
jgi:archaemetzincin